VLPDSHIGCDTVLAVVEEDDHSIGVHGLANEELVVLEVGDDLLGESRAAWQLVPALTMEGAQTYVGTGMVNCGGKRRSAMDASGLCLKGETHALVSKSLTSESSAPFAFMASLTFFMYVLRCER
jgi:hypothetical protein